MKEHNLKTDSEIFQAVVEGKIRYNIRFNDRSFKIGDTLYLMETKYTGKEMEGGDKPLVYTGNVASFRITHILEGPIYGLKSGWVILSLENVE